MVQYTISKILSHGTVGGRLSSINDSNASAFERWKAILAEIDKHENSEPQLAAHYRHRLAELSDRVE